MPISSFLTSEIPEKTNDGSQENDDFSFEDDVRKKKGTMKKKRFRTKDYKHDDISSK